MAVINVPFSILFLTLTSLFSSLCVSQSWDYKHVEYLTEEVPIYTIIKETKASGYYDYGNGMTMKAVVMELGTCSSGHPCSLTSGLSWLYPDGCPLDQCTARWVGDPWRSYSWQCENKITPASASVLPLVHANNTRLSTEWWVEGGLNCMLRYDNVKDEWVHEKEGVALVVKSQGFNFPAQTVLVLDVDSLSAADGAIHWPDVVQEASTNFAVLGSTLIKPTNTYAEDHYTPAELGSTKTLLTEVKVTLTQDMLDELELGISEDYVMGSIAGLTSDLVDNAPELYYPTYDTDIAGGMVWADFASDFDTMAYTITLARIHTGDPDQTINLHPLKVNVRCQCSVETKQMMVIRPTVTEFLCTAHLATVNMYTCDGSGPYYCNQVTVTAWDRSTPDNLDGTLGCSPRNSTKAILDVAVADVGPPAWTWPSTVASAPLPSATPNASPSPSSSVSPTPTPIR